VKEAHFTCPSEKGTAGQSSTRPRTTNKNYKAEKMIHKKKVPVVKKKGGPTYCYGEPNFMPGRILITDNLEDPREGRKKYPAS